MIKKLVKVESALYGDTSGIIGDTKGVWRDATGVRGDVTKVKGNLDECEISDGERGKEIDIEDLIQYPKE